MLKLYYARDDKSSSAAKPDTPPVTGCSALIVAESVPGDGDGLAVRPDALQSARLQVLPKHLSHLAPEQQNYVVNLVAECPCLFGDIPSRMS